MKSKKLKVLTPKNLTKEDYAIMAQTYSETSAKIKSLEDIKKKLADQLKEGAAILGVTDDKGSYYLDSEDFIIGKVASKKMSLNLENAKKVLTVSQAKKCIKKVTTEIIDEAEVTKLVSAGELNLDTVSKFTDTQVTYRVSVEKKEDIPEVEKATFSSAASRKAGKK